MTNFFSLDPNGVMTYVNINDPGLPLRIVHGKNLWLENPEEVGGAFYEACLNALRDQADVSMEIYNPSRETWWGIQIYPVPGGLAVYCRNISIVKSRAEKLGMIQAKLTMANKTINSLKLGAWRSAIDAHFILGALNSIQHYIIGNKKENAINYLASFSKLIRAVRNSVVSDTTSLRNELELVRNYVRLEQLRDNGKFDFTFTLSADVDLNLKIPPMIIQPLVENAIVYRLRNRTEKKRGILTLSIESENDQLILRVEDNAVNHEEGQTMQQQLEGDAWVSSMITEEYLRLMNSEEGNFISITDKMENGKASGTIIILRIPGVPGREAHPGRKKILAEQD